MPIYDYTCLDEKGKTVHGSLEAPNEGELKVLIPVLGLFLVSWTVRQSGSLPPKDRESKGADPREIERITDLTKLSPLEKRIERTKAFFRQPAGIALLAAVALLIGCVEYFYLVRVAHVNVLSTPDTSKSFGGSIAQLHKGLTRAEVERLFPNHTLTLSSASKITYWITPSLTVVVDYDSVRGRDRPDNKVITWSQVVIGDDL